MSSSGQGSGEGEEGQSQEKSSFENSKLKEVDLSSTLFLVFTTHPPPQTFFGLLRGLDMYFIELKVFRWTQEEVIWVRNGQGWFQLKFKGST